MDNSEIVTTDSNNLYLSAMRAKSSSPHKESTQKFTRNILSEIARAQEELHSRKWKISPMRPFLINERGHIRKIEGNTCYDRMVIHSYIDYAVAPELEKYLIFDNYASQIGKGVSLARNRFAEFMHKAYRTYGNNNFYILIIDFAKFYDNVQHEKLYRVLMNYLPHEEFHDYMLWQIFESFKVDVSYMNDEEYKNCLNEKYISLDHIHDKHLGEKYMYKSLNIGNQGSQIFSIFYPTRIDNYLRIVKGEKLHGRYMDDTFIISNNIQHLKQTQKELEPICEDMGLFINLKKTQIYKANTNFKFLNRIYRMTNTGHLIERLDSSTVTRERRKLKKFRNLVENGKMSFTDADNQFRCWRGMFYRYMSKEQRNNMDKYFSMIKEA